MPYQSYVTGPVFVLRWDNVVPTDVPKLCEDLQAAAEAAGDAVFCLNILPEHGGLPSKQTRSFIVKSWSKLMENVRVSYVVVEGNSMASVLQRSVITAVRALLHRRDSMVGCRTVRRALEAVAADADIDPEAVLNALRRKNMIAES